MTANLKECRERGSRKPVLSICASVGDVSMGPKEPLTMPCLQADS